MSATGPSAVYHRLTSYDSQRHWTTPLADPRVDQSFVPMQAAQRPAAEKSYPPDLPRVHLPACDPAQLPAAEAGKLDLARLSVMLSYSLGVLGGPGGPGARPSVRRAASSAGNCHPVSAYLCARGVPGLPDGVWHYAPSEHLLIRIGPPAEADHCAVVLSGIPWRTCWRYRERGYRHLWWDAGTVLMQLLGVAQQVGLRPVPDLGFPDRQIAMLIGADLVTELPLVLVGLDGRRPVLGPPMLGPTVLGAPAIPGELGPSGREFPLVTRSHKAGCFGTATQAERWTGRADHAPPDAGGLLGGPVTEAVDQRRTTRRLHPAGVSADECHAVLSMLDALPWITTGHELVELDLLVHGVSDLDAGVYAWRDGQLHPQLLGSHRRAAQRLCLDQAPGAECAAVLVWSTDLAEVTRRYGERGYRAVQMRAGMVVGALYLGAAAWGFGCTALTLRDCVVPELLGRRGAAGLLGAALGVT